MSKKKQKAQKVQTSRSCLFCNKTPLTEEHLWPQWMKEFRHGPSFNKYRRDIEFINIEGNEGREITTIEPRNRTGHPSGRKAKVVCAECNNNWMSRLETLAKPILSALILGQDIDLSAEQQNIISKWAFLKTIVGEHIEETIKIIPEVDRVGFMENLSIPSEWKVWIARVSPPDWNYQFSQTSGEFSMTGKMTGKHSIHRSKYTSFVLGELLIYIAYYPLAGFNLDVNKYQYRILTDFRHKLTQIYPQTKRTVSWKNFIPISNKEQRLLHNNYKVFNRKFSEFMKSIEGFIYP